MTKAETYDAKRFRKLSPPSNLDKSRRFAWRLVEATLYRWSPIPMHPWRCALLRWFGAQISASCHPYPSARIWAPWNLEMKAGSCLGPDVICYSVGRIKLGAGAIVSQGSHLCAATHDHNASEFPLLAGDIEIGCSAWIAAEAFIAPGVTIGQCAVVGARAVAAKDVPDGSVVVGNPACVVGQRSLNPL